ncbi:MAG: hypothetical protein QOD41_309 [Cryptosporangiaceae bacterium]|nr:hypothetical protein [Cryptosporangiaceae bacterium]
MTCRRGPWRAPGGTSPADRGPPSATATLVADGLDSACRDQFANALSMCGVPPVVVMCAKGLSASASASSQAYTERLSWSSPAAAIRSRAGSQASSLAAWQASRASVLPWNCRTAARSGRSRIGGGTAACGRGSGAWPAQTRAADPGLRSWRRPPGRCVRHRRPAAPVTFFAAPGWGCLVARSGMTYCPCRTHDPGGVVAGPGGAGGPLIGTRPPRLWVGLSVTWLPAAGAGLRPGFRVSEGRQVRARRIRRVLRVGRRQG